MDILCHDSHSIMVLFDAGGASIPRPYGRGFMCDVKLPKNTIRAVAHLTCPYCHFIQEVTTPTDVCQQVYKCVQCGEMLKPKEGDYCMFCSFADSKCPPKQIERANS